jgi:hypothetical protein
MPLCRRCLSFLFLAGIPCFSVFAAGVEDNGHPKGGKILTQNQAVLTTGEWIPTLEQADSSIQAIVPFLLDKWRAGGRNGDKVREILDQLDSYRVQFVGQMKGGKRVLWCNFFPATDDFPEWRVLEYTVLDGGISYWQLRYDTDTGECFDFLYGGDA